MNNNTTFALSKDQIDKAIKWVRKKWKDNPNKNCEICAKEKWVLEENIVTPIIFSQNFSFDKACPQFMLTCQNCGNTKYFNAVLSKIYRN